MRVRTLFVLLPALAALGAPHAAGARPAPAPRQVFLTVEEALALAFGEAEVARTTAYLTEAQLARARELSGAEVESALVHPYVARDERGRLLGTAYFDAHRVRTLQETLFVVVAPDGRVARVELCSFDEPPDYVPRGSWYAQFLGRRLDDELELKRGICGVTGATLTARATTCSVRRVLALHRVLGEQPVRVAVPGEPVPR
jgi:hypothetical protein